MKYVIVALALSALGCGSSAPLDPADFELPGAWVGDFRTGAFSVGTIQMTLDPDKDGPVEEYTGQGTLFTNQPYRFQHVKVEFDTGARTIRMVIIDFPIGLNEMLGSYDGTSISVVDDTFCHCQMFLTR
jgi:hypothetical protein